MSIKSYFFIFALLIILGLISSACSSDAGAAPTATLNPRQAEGKQVFNAHCATCHALVRNTVIVGPSLYGIATRAAERMPGVGAEEYIEMSILEPDAYVVDGFQNVMIKNLSMQLTSEDLDAVVAFLMTLK